MDCIVWFACFAWPGSDNGCSNISRTRLVNTSVPVFTLCVLVLTDWLPRETRKVTSRSRFSIGMSFKGFLLMSVHFPQVFWSLLWWTNRKPPLHLCNKNWFQTWGQICSLSPKQICPEMLSISMFNLLQVLSDELWKCSSSHTRLRICLKNTAIKKAIDLLKVN